MTTKQHQSEPAVEPALVIPGVSPIFPPSLLVALKEMTAQAQVVERARDGLDKLETKASELRARSAALKAEIESSTGAAAAAIAMGIGKADSEREARIADKTAELATIEKSLAEIAQARSAAPELFENVRKPLSAAIEAFCREFSDAVAPLDAWASESLSTLETMTRQVQHFAKGLENWGEVAARTRLVDMKAGHPLALFPQLAEFHRAIETAKSWDKPLRPPKGEAKPEPQRERMISVSGGRG